MMEKYASWKDTIIFCIVWFSFVILGIGAGISLLPSGNHDHQTVIIHITDKFIDGGRFFVKDSNGDLYEAYNLAIFNQLRNDTHTVEVMNEVPYTIWKILS